MDLESSKKRLEEYLKNRPNTITVNTIEEYHAAKQLKGKTIHFGNDEIANYGSKDLNKRNQAKLATRQGFSKSEYGNYTYNLNSKFNFGKHKGNELKYVYKCDPFYLEWAMQKASGVIISTETIKVLQNEKVFNVDDLLNFAKTIDSETLELDLTSFPVNTKNFPYSNQVREEDFYFSKEAINSNLIKRQSKMTTSDLFKGGNWGKSSFIQDKRIQKKNIIIKK